MTLLKSLDFINTSENTRVLILSDEEEEFVEDLKKSVQEVDLHLKGKIKLKNAKDILNEI